MKTTKIEKPTMPLPFKSKCLECIYFGKCLQIDQIVCAKKNRAFFLAAFLCELEKAKYLCNYLCDEHTLADYENACNRARNMFKTFCFKLHNLLLNVLKLDFGGITCQIYETTVKNFAKELKNWELINWWNCVFSDLPVSIELEW